MCGRFACTDIDAIFSKYRVVIAEDIEEQLSPRYNIAPSQSVAVIHQNKNQENVLEMMRWGLVPFWAKDPQIGYKMINARAETLTTKPSFKQPLKSKRCLVPSTGFYEWKKVNKNKVPYYIGLGNNELFSFAGLYDIWKDVKGNKLKTFTIITTAPNNTLQSIHNRMPVILEKEYENQWLDITLQNPDLLMRMLKPYPDDNIQAYIVSKEINSPSNDYPQLIEEVKDNIL